MHDFTKLEISELTFVTGGTGGQTTTVEVGANAQRGRIQVGATATVSQSDYAKCVSTVSQMPGAKPADIRASCGLPPEQGR